MSECGYIYMYALEFFAGGVREDFESLDKP